MTHRRALVHDLDAVRPEVVDMFLRLVARRFDDLDAAVDDRLAIFRVRRRIDRWQDRQVHAERLAGHCAKALELGAQRIGRGLRQRGENAATAGLSIRRRDFGAADTHHADLDYRLLDADQSVEELTTASRW